MSFVRTTEGVSKGGGVGHIPQQTAGMPPRHRTACLGGMLVHAVPSQDGITGVMLRAAADFACLCYLMYHKLLADATCSHV